MRDNEEPRRLSSRSSTRVQSILLLWAQEEEVCKLFIRRRRQAWPSLFSISLKFQSSFPRSAEEEEEEVTPRVSFHCRRRSSILFATCFAIVHKAHRRSCAQRAQLACSTPNETCLVLAVALRLGFGGASTRFATRFKWKMFSNL